MKRTAFNTRILHEAADRDPYTGAVSIPIYQVSTFHQDVDHPGPYDYSRSGNPTRAALEELIAKLEGGARGFAFASGMATTSTVLLLFEPGDHIIVSSDIYGGTYRVLTKVFSRWQLNVSFIDTTHPKEVREAINSRTKALFIETPSNPMLKVTDLPEMIDIAKEHGLITIVDNTFLTPYFCRPLELGADIVIHSATKFLNGHSDVVAGLAVAKSEELAEKIGFLQNAFGAVLGPHDSWLLIRGLKTLGIRMEKQAQNALLLAKWLEAQPWVKRVCYPGLSQHEGKRVLENHSSGYGAILAFEVNDTDLFKKILRNMNLPAVGVSLGAVETILTHPATMSHASMPKEQRQKLGISDTLLRLSVGLEDPEDLIHDFEALASLF